jgi:hypothetical protein
MMIKTVSGSTVDISVEEVLRAAGVIYQARRRIHGGPPKHSFRCRWCNAEVKGRATLDRHERNCNARPSGDFTDADLAAMAWPPANGG